MTDLAKRFPRNPLLSPRDLKPSMEGLEVTCLLNPGVFRFQNKTWLIVRVAERPAQKDGVISFPILTESGSMRLMEIPKDHPELRATDPRVINFQGNDYLTTLSHLRLLASDDGVTFKEVDGFKPLMGEGKLETFGIEDCRVSFLDNKYWLTFTSVSDNGVGVGLRTTSDWQRFQNHGMMLPPHNKDCAIFEEKVGGKYYALHRPSSVDLGGNYIWLCESPDGLHWGNHKCIAKSRPGMWDSKRVGAGAAPIKTAKGWLEIYHGADEKHRYGLGALLLDLHDPSKVIARSETPIMIPREDYELKGFFGEVVFTNGHVVDGDKITMYYGAADEVVCGAELSVQEILACLLK